MMITRIDIAIGKFTQIDSVELRIKVYKYTVIIGIITLELLYLTSKEVSSNAMRYLK